MANTTTELSHNTTVSASECLVLQPRDFIPWNNSDTIVSLQTETLVRKLRDLVFLPITFLIGVPANVINMAVFYKQGLKERINVCLFALSFSDMMYLVVNMVSFGEQLYIQSTTKERNGPFLQWITNHNLLGLYGFSWVSQVLTAIIASERCFCILQPLKSQTVLRTSTMSAIIVVVFIVVIGVRFLVVTRYYLICAYDPYSDSTIVVDIGQPFYYQHQTLVDLLDVFMYGVGLPWVVIVVVMVTTIITVIKLRQAAEWRAGMSSSSGSVSARDIALTRMLVGNSIFFTVCVFPVGLFRFALLFLPEMTSGGRNNNLFTTLLCLIIGITYINCTFNIVVYYTMGSRYRHTVRTLLGRKRGKEAPTSRNGTFAESTSKPDAQ